MLFGLLLPLHTQFSPAPFPSRPVPLLISLAHFDTVPDIAIRSHAACFLAVWPLRMRHTQAPTLDVCHSTARPNNASSVHCATLGCFPLLCLQYTSVLSLVSMPQCCYCLSFAVASIFRAAHFSCCYSDQLCPAVFSLEGFGPRRTNLFAKTRNPYAPY